MAQNKQNNVLVFGGSSGVGLGIAELALTQLPKANVIIASSSEDKLAKAVEAIRHAKPDGAILDSVAVDLANLDTQSTEIENALKTATAKFGGKIDHIVWTAGTPFPSGDFQQGNHAIMSQIAGARLYGPLALGSMAKKYMNDNKNSSITLTSGILVHRPIPGQASLIAAIGGVEGGTRALAVDLAPIRVNATVLGVIQTPLLDAMTQDNTALKEAWAAGTLVKAIGTANEAAEAYLYSMRCAFVTGTVINVDGGAQLV